jgi:fatty acid desaturase
MAGDESARMMKIPYVAMGFIAWACVIGLAVASWTPGQEMVRTWFRPTTGTHDGLPMAGIAVLAAYPQIPPWLIAVLLGVYAGVLELGQMYIPGPPGCACARLFA